MSAWLPHFDYKERHYFLGQEKTLLKLFQKLSFKVFRERSGRQKEIMIFKRAVSTLIPPKVVSSKNIGSAPNAKRIANVVQDQHQPSRLTLDWPDTKPSTLMGIMLVVNHCGILL